MKHFYFILLVLFFLPLAMYSQTLDTLVDVGGYKMHFNIIKGKGTPILFEAGGGNDGSIWNHLLEKIHKVTGTTLITYDRSGFGKSELNPNLKKESDFGIVNGIKELEIGLSKLGYSNEIILVSHSYGGLYNLLYTHKHPKKVVSIILIDVTLSNFWNEELLALRDKNIDISSIKKPSGDYYLNANFKETMRFMRGMEFPNNIPIINIFPENSFSGFPEVLTSRWLKLHKELGDYRGNIKNIIAQGSTHAIFQDNPGLVINTIIKAYSETRNKNQQSILLKKALDNAIDLSIDAKKKTMENWHSENDLNEWGYTLMRNKKLKKALQVFKLNKMLFPNSWMVYDSYGEALLRLNRKAEAMEMYKKSIALHPENENAKKVLLQLKEE